MLANERQGAVGEGADPGKALVIAVDDRLAFFLGHAEPTGDAPRRAAVEDREIDRLGLVAGVAIDPSEQFLGGQAVNIDAIAERILQLRDVGHVRRQPKLDLAIVGAQQLEPWLGDEGVADLASDLGADRNVLKVRVVGRQAPGLRAGHRELVWTRPVAGLICACSASV